MAVIASVFRKMKDLIWRRPCPVAFTNSSLYWDERYKAGGNSGAGSYGRLAQFKATILNDFVVKHGIRSVVEYGCGDGSQLDLATYPEYTGFDVSPTAVEICRTRFANRPHFRFFGTDVTLEQEGCFDLAISLDVIYHLIEDDSFDAYMRRLFASSRNFVIIYSNNIDKEFPVRHVKGREFSRWCGEHAKEWRLFQIIKNPYPYDPALPNDTSHSDFFIYKKGHR